MSDSMEWKMVPVEPTEAMLNAARDWSAAKYGKPVGNDGASGCYRAMLAAAPPVAVEPVAWQGGEEWERLAWHLCAEECGEDACTELIWESGAIPEPWGDRWLKYEQPAKDMIAKVREHVGPIGAAHPPLAAPGITDEQRERIKALADEMVGAMAREPIEACRGGFSAARTALHAAIDALAAAPADEQSDGA